MLVRLAPSVYIVYCEYLLNSFPESREVVALLLESCNSLYDSYMSAESRLIDIPSESDLLVWVVN
jgi:hypothetical protein